MEIICKGETIILSSARAAYRPATKTLILADMHLGKTAYFRNSGIQVPSTIMLDDLQRLSVLIQTFQPKEILVVGDMFHHNFNADILLFKAWREKYNDILFTLVPGNHDKLIKIDYQQLGIQLTPPKYLSGNFLFEHETKEITNDHFSISGHLHPGYVMGGRARQHLRLPCFIYSPKHLVMSAFSMFTGLYTGYEVQEDNSYYVIGGNDIYCL